MKIVDVAKMTSSSGLTEEGRKLYLIMSVILNLEQACLIFLQANSRQLRFLLLVLCVLILHVHKCCQKILRRRRGLLAIML